MVKRYQRGNKKQQIKEGHTIQWPKDRHHNGQKIDNTMAKRQTPQWPKEKVQQDKQQSTKHTHKTKDQ